MLGGQVVLPADDLEAGEAGAAFIGAPDGVDKEGAAVEGDFILALVDLCAAAHGLGVIPPAQLPRVPGGDGEIGVHLLRRGCEGLEIGDAGIEQDEAADRIMGNVAIDHGRDLFVEERGLLLGARRQAKEAHCRQQQREDAFRQRFHGSPLPRPSYLLFVQY